MLDLEPGVHFQEVELAVMRVQQKLCGAGVDVSGCAGHGYCGVTDALAKFRRQYGRRSLFDDLLMAALYAAFPLAQVDGVAGPVGQHLYLDMPWVGDVAFQEHAPVAEGRLRFPAGSLDTGVQLTPRVDQAHTPATAASGRLDQQRESPALHELLCRRVTRQAFGRTGHNRDPGA